LFSVVYIQPHTVEDSDALLTVIGYVVPVSKFGSFPLRSEGVAFYRVGAAGVIPTI